MMKPILFNTEMVKAILGGAKTQTRRVIKPQPEFDKGFWILGGAGWSDTITKFHPVYGHSLWNRCPVHAGDILYVRETWQQTESGGFIYRADKTEHGSAAYYNEYARLSGGWRPSIHMPKKAARIFLRVTDVWLERLQRSFFEPISPIFTVQAEGIDIGDHCRECIDAYCHPCCVDEMDDDGTTHGECGMLDDPRYEFSKLWDSTIKPADLPRYGWVANPWVWVIEFERCEKPEV